MDPALRTAASGMQAQQTRTDTIANNLANVNTTGYKRQRAHFSDLLYQTLHGPDVVGQQQAETLPAVQVGRGVKLADVQSITSQGPLEQTDRPMDVAVEGEGYFEVTMPDGSSAYTRDGSFQISDQGSLVTSQGYAIQPGIKLPPQSSEVTISKNGTVSAKVGTSGTPQEVGRIELTRFANPAGLTRLGDNLLGATAASGDAVRGNAQDQGFGAISQGFLEGSNVEIVQEMVDMISAMRAYELNSKAIQNADQMGQVANGLIR